MAGVWVNGCLESKVSPFDRGLAYGDGLFATMRTARSAEQALSGKEIKGESARILFFEAHLARLKQGAARLGIAWQPSTSLKNQLLKIAALNPDACIKLLLTRGKGGRGYAPPCNPTVSEIISVHALPAHYPQWQQDGVRLQISPVKMGHQPLLAGIKHCNRLEQVLIKSQVLPSHREDWLVLDMYDNVIESSMANLFFITQNQVITPSLSHCGVSGMMREQIIYQLLNMGYSIESHAVPVSSLTRFEHILMTNSLLGAIDITCINQHKYQAFPQTQKLREKLFVNL